MSAQDSHGGVVTSVQIGDEGQRLHFLSLRDYFAGQALAGYFASPHTPHQNATDCAAYIYDMADAMLAAREGGEA